MIPEADIRYSFLQCKYLFNAFAEYLLGAENTAVCFHGRGQFLAQGIHRFTVSCLFPMRQSLQCRRQASIIQWLMIVVFTQVFDNLIAGRPPEHDNVQQ